MDSNRPSLDLKHFEDICPNKNGKLSSTNFLWIRLTWVILQVPVIAVFTKYDQFKRDIRMKLLDEGRDSETHFETEAKRVFDQYYLGGLQVSEPPPFVLLESEDLF